MPCADRVFLEAKPREAHPAAIDICYRHAPEACGCVCVHREYCTMHHLKEHENVRCRCMHHSGEQQNAHCRCMHHLKEQQNGLCVAARIFRKSNKNAHDRCVHSLLQCFTAHFSEFEYQYRIIFFIFNVYCFQVACVLSSLFVVSP